MKRKIKLFDPVVTGKEILYIKDILKSGFWASGAGIGYVLDFEKKFQKYIGSKECIAVNSGTAALHLALSTMNLENQEVIIPSLSFVSTAHAVLYNKAKPIFVDVDPKTLCLDITEVEKKITKKTKAILPVHFAGIPANLAHLTKLARDSKISLIEDAAHACGAEFGGKKIGSHGNMVCFSFHPVKNLAMPSGGLVAINQSNSKEVKKTLASKRWCGITERKGTFYNIKKIGWNFYMNEFSAAIGLAQLEKLDSTNAQRQKIAKRYHQEINLERKMPFDKNSCYHFYWILVKNRDQFRKNMADIGIETGTHYTPIHQFSMYRGSDKLPITESISKSIVSLPTHPNLSENDVDYVIKSINEIV
ncbi:DegT/DnrJ/EryC1/StrS family aminotransferase [Candidatus Nitrosotenuis sp. DW1]|uniref:DegT/DnrJ/EryC1/StrS family aminotransferase n=1 Tax=Candidatus Nitrosotenuis sp. DW1 TaxID=2259672 RepID=UPI0015CE1A89|nr:DegT/DnrJ/EryC1/StrS family aminotransferase [Candidatus Nitrosotenuis sp. DW1]QLH09694.1 DegT/DnrJ/EryC1/StrS family aminotransferase [Candidatus Nitrosotenuis sp. DW1]